jgi:ATP-dependent helicase IRC3
VKVAIFENYTEFNFTNERKGRKEESMKIQLRPYQAECLQAIKSSHASGIRRQLISMATGAEKTIVFSRLVKDLNVKSILFAHTLELVEQGREKIKMLNHNLKVGIVNGLKKEFDQQIVISTIQSAMRPDTLAELKKQNFQLCIYDECHRCGSETSREVLNELGFGKNTSKLLTGFTATPFRQDGKGLREVFDAISYEKGVKELIKEVYLCPPKGIKISTDIDLSKVKIGDSADFQTDSLSQVMDIPEVRLLIVNSYLEKGQGRQTICFGVNVKNARNLSELFKEHGISSEYVHGGTPKSEREGILKRYQSGQTKVLCNCLVLTEGFDAPETSCVIIGRPTQSKGLFRQMAGRGLRLFPNKRDCLIFDLCTKHHSLCGTATLLEDERINREEKGEGRQKEEVEHLPINLNQKLKSALINFDPLGDSFTWSLSDNRYVLKGCSVKLEIVPVGDDRYRVILVSEQGIRVVAQGLDFSYSFCVAEEFAKENRSLFVFSDRSANWRELPASTKQISCIKSNGYRAGIEALTRGQASDLLVSGALRRFKK